jgi:AbrB family looped-hinge helix DNA binding protein
LIEKPYGRKKVRKFIEDRAPPKHLFVGSTYGFKYPLPKIYLVNLEHGHIIMRKGNRITIPKRICKQMGVGPGAVLEFRVKDKRIMLRVFKK